MKYHDYKHIIQNHNKYIHLHNHSLFIFSFLPNVLLTLWSHKKQADEKLIISLMNKRSTRTIACSKIITINLTWIIFNNNDNLDSINDIFSETLTQDLQNYCWTALAISIQSSWYFHQVYCSRTLLLPTFLLGKDETILLIHDLFWKIIVESKEMKKS